MQLAQSSYIDNMTRVRATWSLRAELNVLVQRTAT